MNINRRGRCVRLYVCYLASSCAPQNKDYDMVVDNLRMIIQVALLQARSARPIKHQK